MTNGSDFAALYENIKDIPPVQITVADLVKPEVIEVLKRLQEENLAELTFIGETGWIFQLAERVGLNMSKFKLIHEPQSDEKLVQVAIEEARKGNIEILMNGSAGNKYMLEAVLDLKTGLSTNRFFSQLTALEVPGASKLLFIANTGISAGPRELVMRDTLMNTLDYLRKLGKKKVRVVVLNIVSPDELPDNYSHVSAAIQDISFLEGIKENYPELILLGPMSLKEAIQGELPDVLLTPNIATGEMLCQTLCAFAGGKAGRLLLGGRVPLILTINNRTEEDIWRSLLLALQIFNKG